MVWVVSCCWKARGMFKTSSSNTLYFTILEGLPWFTFSFMLPMYPHFENSLISLDSRLDSRLYSRTLIFSNIQSSSSSFKYFFICKQLPFSFPSIVYTIFILVLSFFLSCFIAVPSIITSILYFILSSFYLSNIILKLKLSFFFYYSISILLS